MYPTDSKGKVGDTLKVFCREFGVPEHLTVDGSKEQCYKGSEFMKQVHENNIEHQITEPNLHQQHPAESIIREVRRRWYRTLGLRNEIGYRCYEYNS